MGKNKLTNLLSIGSPETSDATFPATTNTRRHSLDLLTEHVCKLRVTNSGQ